MSRLIFDITVLAFTSKTRFSISGLSLNESSLRGYFLYPMFLLCSLYRKMSLNFELSNFYLETFRFCLYASLMLLGACSLSALHNLILQILWHFYTSCFKSCLKIFFSKRNFNFRFIFSSYSSHFRFFPHPHPCSQQSFFLYADFIHETCFFLIIIPFHYVLKFFTLNILDPGFTWWGPW